MIKLKVNELSFRMSQMDCCFNKNKIFHIYKLSYCNKDPLLALLNFRGKNLLQSMIYRKDDFQIYSWKIWFFSINQGINNSQIQITTNTEIILHFSQLSFQQRLSSLIGFNGYYRILQKQWNDDESEFGGRDFPELKPWKVNDIFNFSWKIEQNRRVTEYSYGYWSRFLWNGPNKLVDKTAKEIVHWVNGYKTFIRQENCKDILYQIVNESY